MTSILRTPRPLKLGALSVLVIDDQPFFRVLLTEVLRSFGVQKIEVASDGVEGFEAFMNSSPDIVITDWMMPNLDGIALTQKIRKLRGDERNETPIVLVTANNQRKQIELARAAGIDEFILKPVSAKSVCDRIREVVERPRKFVSFPAYTGPCRRRRADPAFAGPLRRYDDPLLIDGTDEEIMAEGLRSVLEEASARVQLLIKALSTNKSDLTSIHSALSEMHAIAEDIGDKELEGIFSIMVQTVVAMSKSGKVVPSVILSHLHGVDVLLRTPAYQTELRKNVVRGLARQGGASAAA